MADPEKKIKVMTLVPTMRTGGAERVISVLLQQMDRRLFVPELAIAFDSEVAYAIPDDVPVFVLDREPTADGNALLAGLPPSIRERSEGSVAWLSGIAGKLGELVQRQRPDVIISSPLWASILAVVAHDAFPASTRLINRVDAPPSVSLAQSELQDLFTHLMRQYFNRADRVVAVSHAVGRDLVENFGVDEGRIEVVHNPVDVAGIRDMAKESVDEPVFAVETPTVLFVGRLERVKGLEYLLRATAKVLEVTPMNCVLVGDGSHQGYLRALAKHLGIAERVHFLGRKRNPFKYLSRATVFVLPSLSEGMPNVLLEAMTCGCPVIASDIAGGITREVLDEGAYGLIVPREDDDALAVAILRMLEDQTLREGFSRGGVERAQEFDLPRIMQVNQDVIRAVAGMESSGDCRSAESASVVGAKAPAPQQPVPQRTANVRRAIRYSRLANAARILRHQGIRAFGSRVKRELRRTASTSPGAIGASEAGYGAPELSASREPSGKINLAIVVPSLDDEFIGAGTDVLLKYLNRDAFDISLIRVDRRPDRKRVPDDVAQYRVEARSDTATPFEADLPLEVARRYPDEIAWMLSTAEGLSALLEGLHADVVLAEGFYASMLATMASERSTTRLVTIASMYSRAYEFAESVGCSDLYVAVIRRYFGRAAMTLAPNQAIAKDLVEKFGLEAGSIVVVPDAVEAGMADHAGHGWAVQNPRLGEGPPTFVAYANESTWAGLVYVVRALALARRHEAVLCLIVGDGPGLGDLERLASKLGVSNAVAFAANQDGLWRSGRGPAGVVHSPVKFETNLPQAVIDAVAASCAVISARSSDAVAEFLGQGERGVLVPMKDAQALADAMLQLVWDDDARTDMVRRARAHLASVSADVIVPRIEQLIANCVSGVREQCAEDERGGVEN